MAKDKGLAAATCGLAHRPSGAHPPLDGLTGTSPLVRLQYQLLYMPRVTATVKRWPCPHAPRDSDGRSDGSGRRPSPSSDGRPLLRDGATSDGRGPLPPSRGRPPLDGVMAAPLTVAVKWRPRPVWPRGGDQPPTGGDQLARPMAAAMPLLKRLGHPAGACLCPRRHRRRSIHGPWSVGACIVRVARLKGRCVSASVHSPRRTTPGGACGAQPLRRL